MNSTATADTLHFVHTFSGTVNGSPVSGGGEGDANVGGGTLTGDFQLNCPGPNSQASYVIHPNILTGIHPAARSIPPVFNPFNRLQSILFTRTIRFDATTALSAYVTYTPNGSGGISGEFTFMGSVPLQGDLVSIEPTVETWIPSPKPDTIIGHFVMCWKKIDDSLLCGAVSSEYVAGGLHIDQPLFRYITFENTSLTGPIIHQEENIVLFASVGD